VSESDLLAHFRILLGMSKLVIAQTLPPGNTVQLSKKSADQIADISVGSAATNFYDILARQNPVTKNKGFEIIIMRCIM
jgi:hypothetical protein